MSGIKRVRDLSGRGTGHKKQQCRSEMAKLDRIILSSQLKTLLIWKATSLLNTSIIERGVWKTNFKTFNCSQDFV